MQINLSTIKSHLKLMYGTSAAQNERHRENFNIPKDTFENSAIAPIIDRINTPIKDINEYAQILRDLKHAVAYNGDYAYFKDNDLDIYRNVDIKEMGLMPYCGFKDCHEIINKYISGRLSINGKHKAYMSIDPNTIPEAVRLLQ